MSDIVLAEMDTYGVAADHLRGIAGDPPGAEPPSFGDADTDSSMGEFSGSMGAFQDAQTKGAVGLADTVRQLGENFDHADS